jgi:hypothetical protein
MALTVADLADLAEHIIARRRLYALALAADVGLLRRAYGESVVQEALRLADEAAQPKQAPQPPSGEHVRDIADALGRVMGSVSDSKQAGCSSTDQGGGKRRAGSFCQVLPKASRA